MTPEQLEAIQARNTAAKGHRKAFEAACQRFSEGFGADGSMSPYIDDTKDDVPGLIEDNDALLAYARELEAQVKRYAEQDADAFVNLQVTKSQAKLRAKVDDLEARLDLVANQADAAETLCRMNGLDLDLATVPVGAIRAALTATEDRA